MSDTKTEGFELIHGQTGGEKTTSGVPAPAGIHPLLREGLRAFERERAGLLAKGHAEREWVAFHGDRCLGVAASDIELHERWCVEEGLPEAEVFFHSLRPVTKRAFLS